MTIGTNIELCIACGAVKSNVVFAEYCDWSGRSDDALTTIKEVVDFIKANSGEDRSIAVEACESIGASIMSTEYGCSGQTVIIRPPHFVNVETMFLPIIEFGRVCPYIVELLSNGMDVKPGRLDVKTACGLWTAFDLHREDYIKSLRENHKFGKVHKELVSLGIIGNIVIPAIPYDLSLGISFDKFGEFSNAMSKVEHLFKDVSGNVYCKLV